MFLKIPKKKNISNWRSKYSHVKLRCQYIIQQSYSHALTTDSDEFTLFLDKLKHDRDELAVVCIAPLLFLSSNIYSNSAILQRNFAEETAELSRRYRATLDLFFISSHSLSRRLLYPG